MGGVDNVGGPSPVIPPATSSTSGPQGPAEPSEGATQPGGKDKGGVPAEQGESTRQTTILSRDTFLPLLKAARLAASQPLSPLTPGEVLGRTGGEGEVTGQGTAGPTSETGEGHYERPSEFPEALKEAFGALANAPFGARIPGRTGLGAAAAQALFKQYQVVPQELLKKSPALFLFLNTVIGKYPPAEIRNMAEKAGVDLAKVVTALVMEPPAHPETIAGMAGKHQLGADRGALARQAEQLATSQDPLHQLAGRFVKTALGNNPQALQNMLIDPTTFFGTQLWSKLAREQKSFVADGGKTRKATGMLQRGGLSARGLAWVIGEGSDEEEGHGQGGGGGSQQSPGASELQQQKAFYDKWRKGLIKGIKESADAKAGRPSGPPVVEAIPVSELGSTRASYDAARRVVRLGAAFPECLRMHTAGLTLTVAPDGELLEIAMRNPQDRWDLKKDLAPPVLAGLAPARARLVAPREGDVFPTHDRFFTSQDRNVIHLQVEKRPVARRILAATNVLLELDEESRLLGILIWQLSATTARPAGDQKAWIAGLAERGPTVRRS